MKGKFWHKPSFSIYGHKYKLYKGIFSKDVASVKDEFDWVNALWDAGILAGLTFFSTLAGTSALGIGSVTALSSAGVSAGTNFFFLLAMKRNIVKNHQSIEVAK